MLRDLGTPCLIHQPAYSMLNRWIEDGLLDMLDREGIGCIAFCPLAQGLLTGRYLKGIPEDSRAARKGTALESKQVNETYLKKVRALNRMAQARGQSLAQMALAWVLRHPGMTSALIGASRLEQVDENVRALDNLKFDAEELAKIDRILK